MRPLNQIESNPPHTQQLHYYTSKHCATTPEIAGISAPHSNTSDALRTYQQSDQPAASPPTKKSFGSIITNRDATQSQTSLQSTEHQQPVSCWCALLTAWLLLLSAPHRAFNISVAHAQRKLVLRNTCCCCCYCWCSSIHSCLSAAEENNNNTVNPREPSPTTTTQEVKSVYRGSVAARQSCGLISTRSTTLDQSSSADVWTHFPLTIKNEIIFPNDFVAINPWTSSGRDEKKQKDKKNQHAAAAAVV